MVPWLFHFFKRGAFTRKHKKHFFYIKLYEFKQTYTKDIYSFYFKLNYQTLLKSFFFKTARKNQLKVLEARFIFYAWALLIKRERDVQ